MLHLMIINLEQESLAGQDDDAETERAQSAE